MNENVKIYKIINFVFVFFWKEKKVTKKIKKFFEEIILRKKSETDLRNMKIKMISYFFLLSSNMLFRTF